LSALLGDERHGAWRIAPTSQAETSRSYLGDSLVLKTDFRTASGRLRLIDFMPVEANGTSAVIRRLEGLEGEVEFELALSIRFGYGEISPWFAPADDLSAEGFLGEVGPDRVVLRGPGLWRDGAVLRARRVLRVGERADYVLVHSESTSNPPRPVDPDTALASTLSHWHHWIARFRKNTDWTESVTRSLLTLRALTHWSTGGIIASPTLGLPEKRHGPMNWDYRYCWLRDSTFMLTALLNAGFHDEAEAWMSWLLRTLAASPDKMRSVYRVDGGRQIQEREIDTLPGWNGAKPVRVGNAAARQRQLDVYGEILDSLCLCDRAGIALDARAIATSSRLIDDVERIWREPDQGMWESRSAPQHYVYSKVMAWVAIDRFLRLAGRYEGCSPNRQARLLDLREAMHAEICAKGFHTGRGSFVQAYDSARLDASVLLMPIVGFLPASDERVAATIATIADELMEGGLVRRREQLKDGEEEGVFLPCSCWLADCLAMQGRRREACELFERVRAVANDVGLLSEEYDVPSRQLLGNFPQALTHIAIINTGLGLCGPVLQRAGG
jgi:GH15 family glucan-1,4-alpha-glucosidase